MNRQEYKSAAYYKSITGIRFNPTSLYDEEPVYKAGEVIRRIKIFGHVLTEKYAECDLYKTYDGLVDINGFAKHNDLVIDQSGNLRRKAKVVIELPSTNDYQYFDSDEEAMAFVNDLRNKCNSCDNKLM
jgi:hypothetical protein